MVQRYGLATRQEPSATVIPSTSIQFVWGMAMILGLRGVSIWSEDVKNLLPFYRDVLGLNVGFESPGFVVLGEPGVPALVLGTHSEVHGRNADPARHMLGLATDDVRTDWKRVKASS